MMLNHCGHCDQCLPLSVGILESYIDQTGLTLPADRGNYARAVAGVIPYTMAHYDLAYDELTDTDYGPGSNKPLDFVIVGFYGASNLAVTSSDATVSSGFDTAYIPASGSNDEQGIIDYLAAGGTVLLGINQATSYFDPATFTSRASVSAWRTKVNTFLTNIGSACSIDEWSSTYTLSYFTAQTIDGVDETRHSNSAFKKQYIPPYVSGLENRFNAYYSGSFPTSLPSTWTFDHLINYRLGYWHINCNDDDIVSAVPAKVAGFTSSQAGSYPSPTYTEVDYYGAGLLYFYYNSSTYEFVLNDSTLYHDPRLVVESVGGGTLIICPLIYGETHNQVLISSMHLPPNCRRLHVGARYSGTQESTPPHKTEISSIGSIPSAYNYSIMNCGRVDGYEHNSSPTIYASSGTASAPDLSNQGMGGAGGIFFETQTGTASETDSYMVLRMNDSIITPARPVWDDALFERNSNAEQDEDLEILSSSTFVTNAISDGYIASGPSSHFVTSPFRYYVNFEDAPAAAVSVYRASGSGLLTLYNWDGVTLGSGISNAYRVSFIPVIYQNRKLYAPINSENYASSSEVITEEHFIWSRPSNKVHTYPLSRFKDISTNGWYDPQPATDLDLSPTGDYFLLGYGSILTDVSRGQNSSDDGTIYYWSVEEEDLTSHIHLTFSTADAQSHWASWQSLYTQY